MATKKTDWMGYKNTIMWLLLVLVLVPFYPIITIDQSGGITLPSNIVLGVGIVLAMFFIYWKYEPYFQYPYTLLYIVMNFFKDYMGDFNTIPDMLQAYNILFWASTILLILLWEDDIRRMLKKKK